MTCERNAPEATSASRGGRRDAERFVEDAKAVQRVQVIFHLDFLCGLTACSLGHSVHISVLDEQLLQLALGPVACPSQTTVPLAMAGD